MRRILLIAGLLAATATIFVLGTGADDGDDGDYRLRIIFDNAFTVVEGIDMRIAGVVVGKVTGLEVTEDNRAAVTVSIEKPEFADFREDAHCTIRPQSLIGEKYIECSLTEPRTTGEAPPELKVVPEGEPGEGSRLLPVENTSKPVDTDLINNINRLPQRQRLSIILNELGAAVGGRADDLNATIRRANPALGALNRVLEILGEQNQVLRGLATNSDRVLAPLARDRNRVTGFIENAGDVAQATAERRAEFERNLELLPGFLAELRPTMQRLGSFSDEFRPVLTDLQAAAPDINRLFREQGPFAQASIPAIESLGETAEIGRPALLRSKPIIDDLRRLTDEAAPLAEDLGDLTVSLRETGGLERLLDYIFYQVGAINGYDQFGHYLRAGLIVNACSTYSVDRQPGCASKFLAAESAGARAASMKKENVLDAFGVDELQAQQAAGDRARAAQRQQTAGARARGTGAGDAKAIKLPPVLLPGQEAAPAESEPAAEPQDAAAQQQATNDGLLDYLLGGGS